MLPNPRRWVPSFSEDEDDGRPCASQSCSSFLSCGVRRLLSDDWIGPVGDDAASMMKRNQRFDVMSVVSRRPQAWCCRIRRRSDRSCPAVQLLFFFKLIFDRSRNKRTPWWSIIVKLLLFSEHYLHSFQNKTVLFCSLCWFVTLLTSQINWPLIGRLYSMHCRCRSVSQCILDVVLNSHIE